MLEKAKVLLGLRKAEHPRLAPSVAPMSGDHVANILDWAAPEFVLEGKAKGLKGKQLDEFVQQRVETARKTASEMFPTS